MLTRTFLVLGCVLSIMGNAAEAEKAEKGHVTALFGKAKSGATGFFIYSKEKLKSPMYWAGESKWQPMASLGQVGENQVYRIPANEAPKAGQVFHVNARLPDGSRFTDALKLGEEAREDGSIEFTVSVNRFEDAATVAKLDKEAHEKWQRSWEATWEGQFMALLNNYRAQHGLRPIVWDQNAANTARSNNYSGGYHNVQYGFDNWVGSPSSPQEALQRWKNSPGHNANMLNGSLRRGGCHFIPGRHGTLCMSW